MLVVPTAVLTSPPTYLPTDLRNLRRGHVGVGAALKILPIRSVSAFIVTATRHPWFFLLFRTDGLAIGERRFAYPSQVLSAIDEMSKCLGSDEPKTNYGPEAI